MRLNVLAFKAPILEAKGAVPDIRVPIGARIKKEESAEEDDAAVVKITKCKGHDKKDYQSPDIDGDGQVGLSDLGIFLSHWGSDDTRSDLNRDGKVDDKDLKFLLKHYGETRNDGNSPDPSQSDSEAEST